MFFVLVSVYFSVAYIYRHFGLQKKCQKTFFIHIGEITGANADKMKGDMYSVNYQRTLLLFLFE